jgi:hypothetical protein
MMRTLSVSSQNIMQAAGEASAAPTLENPVPDPYLNIHSVARATQGKR